MKDKITKLKNVIKKDGIIKGFYKMTKFFEVNYLSKLNVFNKLDIKKNKDQYIKEIKKILNSKYNRIIVWRSNFGWDVPLYQRPQHMVFSMSKKNTLIFYEVTAFTDKVKTLKKINDKLYLVNFNNLEYAKLLKSELKKIMKPKYVEIYSTEWQNKASDLKEYINDGYKIIYEYIDDLSADITGTKDIPKNVVDKFNYAINDINNVYIVATADKLYNDVLEKRGPNKLIFSSNGVDYDFFQKLDDYKVDDEYLKIINNGKINIGYYGALAKWFDYKLIKKINDTNKYNIILFGVKYDETFDNSHIERLTNVYYMGIKKYEILKYYAKYIDILTIPFQINNITLATSPLKLFEYMSLHIPIVTTAMPECQKYKSVYIAKNHQEFIKLLEQAYKYKDHKMYQQLLTKEAMENSWDNKCDIIIDHLKNDEKELL